MTPRRYLHRRTRARVTSADRGRITLVDVLVVGLIILVAIAIIIYARQV